MSRKLVLAGLAERLWPNRPHVILAVILAISSGVGPASAQTAVDGDKTATGMIDSLSECGSLYAIEKKCYALEKSADGDRSSTAASSRLDRAIHFIYVYGKRSGILEGNLLGRMHLSVEKNMADIGNDCKNLSKLQSKMSFQCDRTLRNLKEKQFNDISY